MSETFDDELKDHFIYRYPTEKANILKSCKTDWQVVINAFPNTEGDIFSAVDLWAMEHNTASVFQLMRILEEGMSALSAEVSVTYNTQSWYNIISEIEKAIKIEAQKPKTSEKESRMQFLSEAAKEFSYFKDGWRNYVSHNKCEYDEHQARSVMEHVRQFMTTLAMNLDFSEESSVRLGPNLLGSHQHKAPERSQ